LLVPTVFAEVSTTYVVFAALLLAAAMTSTALKDDPRFVGVDWALTREKLLSYVERRCGSLDPEDIVQTVIAKAFRTDIVQWDPAAKSIFLYLGSLANTEIYNLRHSRYERKERGELSDVVQNITASAGADPVSMLTESASERRYDRLLRTLRVRLDGAALPLFLLDVHESAPSSHTESTEKALGAGYSMVDITAARQKIHRTIGKVVEDDAQAERAALQAAAR
jgi:DNA-directed RNA polymerase specialized sigma24 family protein